MGHLLEQIGQAQNIQAQHVQPPPCPPGKCGKLTIPLNGKEYYTDVPSIGPTQLGIVPGGKTYSEVRGVDGKVVAIQKHEYVQFIGTGLVAELVDVPTWWEKRDSGLI